jgi:DNA-binding transcriptional regulator YiaG
MTSIKENRKSLNLNIKQMAQAMGVHRQTWIKWEREEQRIPNAANRLIETLIWLKNRELLSEYIAEFII